MQVQLVKTTVVDYFKYIDLYMIDGKLKTFLMKKDQEPNIFVVEKEQDGDNVTEFLQQAKQSTVD